MCDLQGRKWDKMRNEFKFKDNKNESPFKGNEVIKTKRVMARLDAQLRREEETRKKGKK